MHEGHRDRMKRRFIAEGISSFENHNILELLLFFSIPRKDTNEIAHRLIKEFGSLNAVFNADFNDLCKVNGVSENSATLIKLIPEITKKYISGQDCKRTKLDNSETAEEFVKSYFIGETVEKVLLICMDNKCNVLYSDIISDGEISYVKVSMRKFIETALKHRASCVTIAHNHPNGSAEPSGDDLMVTVMVRDALRTIEVVLNDHIIYGGNGKTFSMASDKKYANFFR